MALSWLQRFLKKSRPLSRSAPRRTLTIEALEDRTVPSFLPAVTFPVGVDPRAVTVGDFNNDGKPDIAVDNIGQSSNPQHSVSVLLGNGNGSFQPAITTNVQGSSATGVAQSVAVGDFNGDGKLDVAVNTSGPQGPAVEVLLGKGDGSFQTNHLILPVAPNPFSVAVGDFDHNGTPDLVTANSNGTISVLLNNGNGTFKPRTDLTVSGAPRAIAVGDFNGDGNLDVVVAQQLTNNVSLLLGNGNGTFARPTVFAASSSLSFAPSSLAVGDVNGDGKLDLVVNSIGGEDSTISQFGVLLGNGKGAFSAPIFNAPQGGEDGDVVLGDFNNDGRLDVAVGGEATLADGLAEFNGNGDGTFGAPFLSPHNLSTGGINPFGVAAADLNGDGLVDLVAANTASNSVGVLLNGTAPVTQTITATFSVDGTLRVAGDDQDNTIVVSRDAAGNILVNGGAVPIQGGPATVANTSLILLNGGAGNDHLTIDETNGPLPTARLDGGAGDDVLTAGSAGDVLVGAAGNDTLIGGAGNDTFVWSPGDGSDVVDGRGGKDALTFNGSDLAEKFDISANGSHVRLTRDLGNVTMDVTGVEALEINAAGGADTITVGDLSGTGVSAVSLDLGAADGAADAVVVNGTNHDDAVQILTGFDNPSPIVVQGLPAQVSISGAEGANDTLRINTLGGNDVVDSSSLPAGLIGLTVDLGAGQGAATTTTLNSSAPTTVTGPPVTLTATVTSAAGVPSGTVTFLDGTTVLGSARIDINGQAFLKVSLGVGSHALTASFAGAGFADSTSAAVTETVNRAATTVALTSSVNPAVTGQAVTFTATVAIVAPGAGVPTGTVTFKDGNVVLGTGAVGRDGTATFTTSFAAAGGHTITAVYSGDSKFVGNSQTITEQVNGHARRETTTSVASPASPVAVRQAVTFTAMVSFPTGTDVPTGTVTFFVGNTPVARVTLDARGQAILRGFFSLAGQYTIRAVYSGDANFDPSSQTFIVQVNQ
jgi:hypothetical protein